jgi:hypothetical protein
VSAPLLVRYKRRIAIYRDRTAAQLVAAWDGLATIDQDDLDTYTAATTVPARGGKAAAVALSASFFAVAMGTRPVAVRADDIPSDLKTTAPFHAAWHALSMGRPYDEAREVGRSTAEATGFDFVQSSARLTGDVVAERSGRRVRWNRQPGAASCDWCSSPEVAGQDYATAESADFGHDRCDCDVIPA